MHQELARVSRASLHKVRELAATLGSFSLSPWRDRHKNHEARQRSRLVSIANDEPRDPTTMMGVL